MTVSNRLLHSFLAILAFTNLATIAAEDKSAVQKPNIIFILSDDVGLGNVHCTGGHYNTPNIDALAKSGMRFENCYALPLCGPSRCMLLTGRYPFRTGHISNQSAAALESHKEIMIPTVMKSAGYTTACVGKWGQMPYGPGQWGFDEVMSCKGSGRYRPEQGISYERNGQYQKLKEGEYLPDLMHDFIVSFMEKNKDNPFFLYYPIEAIHGPILKTPDSKRGADKDQLYTDNVEYMDKLVGKLVTELDRLNLREKTLVIFSGDNGTASFGVEAAKVDGKAISGHKASMLEGGSRVPLIVNWLGVTPDGKVSKDLIDFSDFFGTFAELGGAKLPEGVKIDSRSFARQIKGEKGTPRDWVYVELNGKSYVRDARYKLMNNGDFYDLKNAPFEEAPVSPGTTDADALASKKKLKVVLDEHPARSSSGNKKKNKKGKKAARAEKHVSVSTVSGAEDEGRSIPG